VPAKPTARAPRKPAAPALLLPVYQADNAAGLHGLQATTPLDPRVLDAMLPFWTDQYGNPHSRTHYFGWESDDAVEAARKQVPLKPGRCRLLSPACRHPTN
jgi:Aminotransferase class-V